MGEAWDGTPGAWEVHLDGKVMTYEAMVNALHLTPKGKPRAERPARRAVEGIRGLVEADEYRGLPYDPAAAIVARMGRHCGGERVQLVERVPRALGMVHNTARVR